VYVRCVATTFTLITFIKGLTCVCEVCSNSIYANNFYKGLTWCDVVHTTLITLRTSAHVCEVPNNANNFVMYGLI
jgi:hypothetical protein